MGTKLHGKTLPRTSTGREQRAIDKGNARDHAAIPAPKRRD